MYNPLKKLRAWIHKTSWLKLLLITFIGGPVAGVVMFALLLFYFSFNLPDLKSLADYRPNLVTKVYDYKGDLIAEYARERRIYVPYAEIPQPVIQAFLAAEDTAFYDHGGFDPKGIVRAALVNTFTNRKQGASTITQQVAKTFLLSSERTYTRKVKELILARRIEQAFTKQEILELYLNQIFMGAGSYGVAAAAYTYFGKSLDELSIGQRAMLAGMPKAPSAYNPLRYPQAARMRRDVVIRRMETERFITSEQADAAIAADLEINYRPMKDGSDAPYFAEHVRRMMVEKFGETALYTGGYTVYTTLNPAMQTAAQKSVQNGLREYDRRHGWRGAVGRVNNMSNWQARIDEEFKTHRDFLSFAQPVVVLEVDDTAGLAKIGLTAGREGVIPLQAMTWARTYIDADNRGPRVTKPSEVLSVGDIVFATSISLVPGFNEFKNNKNFYSLEQIPTAQGALVSIDNASGAVRAMVGGFSSSSEFNRAVQAERQSGSSFKPFVYAAAFEEGDYNPASIVLDAPVVMRSSEMDEAWKPTNYSEKVYGPSTLRRGLVQSRNLMTIRLARDIGMRSIIRTAGKFGFKTERMQANLSTALGASSTTLLEITSAYSVFPNGGKLIEPYFVERIQDRDGKVVWQGPHRCDTCTGIDAAIDRLPHFEVVAKPVISAPTAYMLTDMMRAVVTEGTGWRARAVGHPVGGKTGTTNNYVDAWFVGFSADYSTGVWIGFDRPVGLGKGETGSSAASPVWTEFMTKALRNHRKKAFAIPDGVTFVRVDAATGKAPTASSEKTILEVFVKGTEPTGGTMVGGPRRQNNTKGGNRNAPKTVETPSKLQDLGIY